MTNTLKLSDSVVKILLNTRTIEGLANELGASPSTVRRWAKGTNSPSPKYQEAIFALLASDNEKLMPRRWQRPKLVVAAVALTAIVLSIISIANNLI